jgi:hypothetical protein
VPDGDLDNLGIGLLAALAGEPIREIAVGLV